MTLSYIIEKFQLYIWRLTESAIPSMWTGFSVSFGGASQVAHQAEAYPGFCSMKRLGVFLLPLDGMLFHRRVAPSSKFADTHLFTWAKRGTVNVKFLA